jgi:lysophospholipase L1-like esterase
LNRVWSSVLVLAALVAGGCSSTTTPTPPPPALSIACPVPPSVTPSFDGDPVAVNYGSPSVTGGASPVTVSCEPNSGSNFPVGTTPVKCTACDATQQTAACTLSVAVAKVPRLAATKFVAFGDSITEGLPDIYHMCSSLTLSRADFLRDLQGLRPPPDSPTSYPSKLLGLLSARYTGQTMAVINEGSGGEFIGQGAADLPRVLTQDAPEVLLLLEGTNDMDGIYFGDDPEAAMTTVVTTLRGMIRYARSRGILVFVGTLTPQRPGACKGYAPAYIGPVNDRIRSMVSGEDATLVDLYAAFGGVASTELIAPDGLHPSEAGNERIADTFFAAIKQRLEN